MFERPPGFSISATTRQSAGFTLIELLVVMAILGLLLTLIALNVKGLNNDAEASSSIVAGAFVQARTQALGTTSAVRATLTGPRALTFETSARCGDTTGWTTLNNVNTTLPDGVNITAPGAATLPWQVCFTSRGELPNLPPSILKLTDARARSRTLTFYLTGSVDTQ
ncbi:prepilin-type N-terminal cleavage/methylation domain-containing protein [Deinococcus sp. Arct2-2]|uniref:prepilin-type N-terminal cleavage/methylation domain-containing protein n=1 Tax=Deinococcus sp. Arct2-2 TaxID=2568653 RepID=UPI0010A38867|nr:prepilin-type N-terminal cleavage/methylation domain-containing protein [Deinococcus sp. Arct2-2]THF71503.1 prepilin-type N-terminal cleavage/methylation domain-containing protein [Deinococcus sp. Arct2-2]